MRDLIKKILREEISGFSNEQLKSAHTLMDVLTKGYHWYYDKPTDDYSVIEGSIWFINPNTKNWLFELEDISGHLNFNGSLYDAFDNYLNVDDLDYSVFESFIMRWVENSLINEVNSTDIQSPDWRSMVEDILNNNIQSIEMYYVTDGEEEEYFKSEDAKKALQKQIQLK